MSRWRKIRHAGAARVFRQAVPYFLRRGLQHVLFASLHPWCLVRLWSAGVTWGPGLRTMGAPDVDIYPGSRVDFGRDVTLASNRKRYVLHQNGPVRIRTLTPASRIVLGDRVWLNGSTIVCRSQFIAIGEGTIFAANATVMDSDFHKPWPPEERLNYPTTEFDAGVTIGRYCWIGLNVTILKGSVVGDGAVVGAGSVVTGEIPANCLAAGVPARVIRMLP